jgi:transglutaminase-like putative cysteine protease
MSDAYLNKLLKAQFDDFKLPWYETILYWIIDSKYGKTKRVDKFISDQLEEPAEELLELAQALSGNNPYQTVYNIEKWVSQNTIYQNDKFTYDADEYWATAIEIIKKGIDDCDGQNSLIHILCRLAGIPEYMIYGAIGDVNSDGKIDHYWTLFFDARRNRFVRLDTTYYPDIVQIHNKKTFKHGKYKVHYIFNGAGTWRFKQ